jgi:predicted nucleic acid-binding Zn ribbon protein
MKCYCDKCATETSGYLLKMNGEPFYKCLTCGHETPFKEHKVISPTFIMKGNGWHNTDYGVKK